jgi:hypothetical protein
MVNASRLRAQTSTPFWIKDFRVPENTMKSMARPIGLNAVGRDQPLSGPWLCFALPDFRVIVDKRNCCQARAVNRMTRGMLNDAHCPSAIDDRLSTQLAPERITTPAQGG